MRRYIFKRVLYGLVALAVIVVLVFVASRALGNPLDLLIPVDALPEERAQIAHLWGLDRPYHVQFFYYVTGLLRGDLGDSVRFGRPATEIFFERLPATAKLMAVSFVFSMAVAIPLGVVAAVKRNTIWDTLAKVVAVSGQALPNFWLGLMLMYLFGVRLGILPTARMGGPSHYVLPAFTLGLFLIAGVARLLRSSMLETLDSEFVKLARIKGVSETAIVWKHCLRNALVPVATFAALYVAVMFGGAVLIETVFAWPGVGRLAYEAVVYRDYPLVQSIVLINAVWILAVNVGVDMLYAYLDPRVRYS